KTTQTCTRTQKTHTDFSFPIITFPLHFILLFPFVCRVYSSETGSHQLANQTFRSVEEVHKLKKQITNRLQSIAKPVVKRIQVAEMNICSDCDHGVSFWKQRPSHDVWNQTDGNDFTIIGNCGNSGTRELNNQYGKKNEEEIACYIVEGNIKDARTLIAMQKPREIVLVVSLLDEALAITPCSDQALKLRMRSLLFLIRFKDVEGKQWSDTLLQRNAALAMLFPVWRRTIAGSSGSKWKHVFPKTKYV
ncbi:transmembrane protein, putative, partial [Medicago truncatula]